MHHDNVYTLYLLTNINDGESPVQGLDRSHLHQGGVPHQELVMEEMYTQLDMQELYGGELLRMWMAWQEEGSTC